MSTVTIKKEYFSRLLLTLVRSFGEHFSTHIISLDFEVEKSTPNIPPQSFLKYILPKQIQQLAEHVYFPNRIKASGHTWAANLMHQSVSIVVAGWISHPTRHQQPRSLCSLSLGDSRGMMDEWTKPCTLSQQHCKTHPQPAVLGSNPCLFKDPPCFVSEWN